MRKSIRLLLLLSLTLAALQSCEVISSIIHDDDVVARIGMKRLYRSQLKGYLPNGISGEDSVNLCMQYINSWAVENLIQDMAEEKLSKQEMDVSVELEDYRKSLIKYRYEQKYINERLDTLVTKAEIETYYKDHQDLFVLKLPVVKARFLDIMKESPNLELLRKKMASNDYEDLADVDSLAYSSALKYEDHSSEWIDMVSFARLFDTDYGTLLSRMRYDGYITIEDERGDVRIGFVLEIRRPGEIGPIEYCEERIKDIIITNRKHSLMSSLEQELLDDALDHENLIIF